MSPTLFVSHGSPTLLIDDCPTRDFLKELGRQLGDVKGILCVSAHWETQVPVLTGVVQLETIHDFFGFPQKLYEKRYPASGNPKLAAQTADLLREAGFEAEVEVVRGLDHGAWVPLALMYPEANVPVIQLSVQPRQSPEHHLRIGTALRSLREEGILILGSGAATHNLREFRWQPLDSPPDRYVTEFDEWLTEAVESGNTSALCDYLETAPHGLKNHPTPEHFLPLFVAMGAAEHPEGWKLHHAFTFGIISMATFAWGGSLNLQPS